MQLNHACSYIKNNAQNFMHFCSWLIGPRPELVDPKFVARGEGRESKKMFYTEKLL